MVEVFFIVRKLKGKNNLKVRKPYDKYVDDVLTNGSTIIQGFGEAAYFMREARKKHFKVYPIHGRPFQRFALTANKPLKKMVDNRSTRYGFYKILRKSWGDLL